MFLYEAKVPHCHIPLPCQQQERFQLQFPHFSMQEISN